MFFLMGRGPEVLVKAWKEVWNAKLTCALVCVRKEEKRVKRNDGGELVDHMLAEDFPKVTSESNSSNNSYGIHRQLVHLYL